MSTPSSFTIELLDHLDDGNWLVRITNAQGGTCRFVAHDTLICRTWPLSFKNLCARQGDYSWLATLDALHETLEDLRTEYLRKRIKEATAQRPYPSVEEMKEFLLSA